MGKRPHPIYTARRKDDRPGATSRTFLELVQTKNKWQMIEHRKIRFATVISTTPKFAPFFERSISHC
jgi:hypothetical protein